MQVDILQYQVSTILQADLIDSDNSVEKSDETARFIANMQQERSIALMLTFLDDDFDSETKKINFNIEEQMVKTDLALENISDWRAPAGVDILRSKLRLQIRIDDFRKLLQEKNNSLNNEKVAYETLQFYTFVTRLKLTMLAIKMGVIVCLLVCSYCMI